MKFIASILLLLCATFALVYSQSNPELVSCTLKSFGSNNIVGNAYFINTNQSSIYNLYVVASGFPSSSAITERGISIHQYADLSSTSSPGGIYSVGTDKTYGCPNGNNAATIMTGALGNVQVGTDGTVNQNIVISQQINLSGTDSIVGHTFAIHAAQDNCTQGSSGDIVAACVLGIGNPATFTLNRDFIPSNANNTANTVQAGSKAICQITPIGSSNITGTVFFEQLTDGSIKIDAKVSGLNATIAHGFHIHTYGDINATSASQTGGHWKLSNQVHALPNSDTRELGDLGNICAYDNDGNSFYDYTTFYFGNFVKMNTSNTGNPSTFIGHSVVVHALRDNGTAGSFGDRIGQCVIGYLPPNKLTTDYFATPSTINFQTTPQCESITFPTDSASSIVLPSTILFSSIILLVVGLLF